MHAGFGKSRTFYVSYDLDHDLDTDLDHEENFKFLSILIFKNRGQFSKKNVFYLHTTLTMTPQVMVKVKCNVTMLLEGHP